MNAIMILTSTITFALCVEQTYAAEIPVGTSTSEAEVISDSADNNQPITRGSLILNIEIEIAEFNNGEVKKMYEEYPSDLIKYSKSLADSWHDALIMIDAAPEEIKEAEDFKEIVSKIKNSTKLVIINRINKKIPEIIEKLKNLLGQLKSEGLIVSGEESDDNADEFFATETPAGSDIDNEGGE